MLNVNDSASNLPFAMQFASVPAVSDVMQLNASTYTTVYTTDCGPNSSPDDGQMVDA